MLGSEARTLCMEGKCSPTEPPLRPSFDFLLYIGQLDSQESNQPISGISVGANMLIKQCLHYIPLSVKKTGARN